MSLTVSAVGVLFLILFWLFHHLGILAKSRAVLAFLGVVIVGTFGFVGNMLAKAGAWAQSMFGSVTGWAVGVPLAAGLFIILAVFVVYDLHPKHNAGKRTGFLALALGTLVVAGVAGIPALAGLRDTIVNLVGNAVTAVNTASGR